MPFASADLGLPQDALDQITARLGNSQNPDPIDDAIARCSQKVTDYTLRYLLAAERVNRLLRPLVLYDLYSNPALAPVPPGVKDAFDDAMKELTDIRDGRFHDLAELAPADPNLSGPLGETGGSHHVSFSRGTI
jgi:hypothetical protein